MGCDIHTIAEVKNENTGKWESCGKIFPYEYYDPEKESKVDDDGYEWNPKTVVSPYSGRNYDLFAILADVRNGRGFAGIKTGEGFNPIDDPRGIPSDASSETKEFLNSYEGDGHSHSYFTVAELLAYDWDQTTIKCGVIPYSEYLKVKETGGSPESWSGGVSGPKIVTYPMNEIPSDIESRIAGGESPYILYEWKIAYRDHCRFFIEDTIPELMKLGRPENVRMLFFFDN